MLLILEILLTIFAWRKGWKWLSLLPLGIGVIVGLVIGVVVGSSGGDFDTLVSMGTVLDIIMVAILIIMVVKGPKAKPNSEPTN